MTATQITIDGLEKSFTRAGTRTIAVNHVDLAIEPGEIFFLLGPSGCGKTTLLRMIAGFIEPTKGRILFDGNDVTWSAPHERRVGMVFQSYALWPHMTVTENVAFGLRVRGETGAGVLQRVQEALELVQMGPYGQRRPNELSGGQQQRVALARALVVKPKVLLLDEPLSNLDAKLRNDLRAEIRRVCKLAGTTTIYVTHDQKEALAIADRIAVLRDGKVCQVGSPTELYENPVSTFVAGFLGDVNLIPAVVESAGAAGAVLRTSFGELRSSHAAAEGLTVGSKVNVGVRPERIAIGSDGDLEGTVSQALFLGDSKQLRIRAGTEELRAIASGKATVRDGDTVRWQLAPSDVMCFPGG